MPYVALERGQTITDDAFAAAILRGLQFRVALRLNADGLPKICERWKEDIERIPHAEAKAASQGLMWFSIGATENAKVPIKPRFEAITGVSQLSGELQEIHAEGLRRFFKEANAAGDLPPNGTTAQVMLLCANQCVRDAESLSELVQWLDNVATNDIRQEFDSMLEWPLVQAVGAFVQTAWTTKHEETVKWEPWLPLLGRLDDYAKRRASLRFGREVAKAKAIILTEYLGRSQEALEVLNEAEASFGPSAILLEQRANVLFQVRDDNEVLEIWNQLTNNSTNKTALDPFAYRRAAMSAARLKRWSKAEQIFHAGADSIKPGTFEVTKFGLKVDAALAASLGGKQTSAATLLGEAVFGLPADATNEGDVRWEAVLRALVEVCRVIENAIWKPAEAQPKFEPGYASSPDLKVSKSEPGQAARGEMVLVQILKLAATLGIDLPGLGERIESLLESRYFVVRWYAAMAQLAVAYGSGAGAGFIKALLAFDAAIGGLSRRPREQSPLAPDDGVGQDGPSAPERWFGLLAAVVCCAAQDLTSNLKTWLDESQSTLGVDAPLSCVVQVLLEGATQPADELYNSSIKASNAAPFRISTAARLLSMAQPPGRVLALQGLLASAVVSDGSYAFQELYNHHVARRFGVSWSTYAQSPFLFYSPRISVPTLLSALNDVEQGNGTLRTVLTAAAAALRQPLGEFMERVW